MGDEERTPEDLAQSLAEDFAEEVNETIDGEPKDEKGDEEKKADEEKTEETSVEDSEKATVKPPALPESQKDEKKSEEDEEEDESEPEVDRLKRYREDLKKAGLGNRARQGERWYQEREELKAKLQKFEALEQQQAELKQKADAIMMVAPSDVKEEWERLRGKYGDSGFIEAYQDYLSNLKKEDEMAYKVQLLEQRDAEREAEAQRAAEERQKEDDARAMEQFQRERSWAMKNLGFKENSKEWKAFEREAYGEYVTRYGELKGSGREEDAEKLSISEVCKALHSQRAKEREALKAALRQEILDEAKKGGVKKRKESRSKETNGSEHPSEVREEEIRTSFADAMEDEMGT